MLLLVPKSPYFCVSATSHWSFTICNPKTCKYRPWVCCVFKCALKYIIFITFAILSQIDIVKRNWNRLKCFELIRRFRNFELSWSISCLFLPKHFFHVRSVQVWLIYEVFEIDWFQVNSLKERKLINFGTPIYTSTPGDNISLSTRPELIFITKMFEIVTTIGKLG